MNPVPGNEISERRRLPLTGVASHGERSYPIEVVSARGLALVVRFLLGSPPDAPLVFDQVRLALGKESAALGRCRFEAHGDGIQGSIVPMDAQIRCRDLLLRRKVVRLDQDFDQLPLLLSRRITIRPEFRAYTADLVYEMAVHRSLFDEIDASLTSESPESQALLRESILAAQGPAFFRFFDERLKILEEMVRPFTRAEHERHGFYFRKSVWGFILTSPFLTRTNLRPRGYSGDSIMMQYLYENTYQGDSLFGRLMHKHPTSAPAAQAVRNRRRLVVESVRRVYHERQDTARPLRILSVACGPAWEVRDLFATAEDCARYEYTLLDQDEEALNEAQQTVEVVGATVGARITARFLRDSVRTMLNTADLSASLGRHDFIYAMGLFDYLTAPVARTVLGKLYQLLTPGGWMKIGNFHVGNRSRIYMEYWLDWVLHYRSEADLAALAQELPGASYRIFLEETGSQMFLEVRQAAK